MAAVPIIRPAIGIYSVPKSIILGEKNNSCHIRQVIYCYIGVKQITPIWRNHYEKGL